MNLEKIKEHLENPTTRREALAALAEWVSKTCLLFGSEVDIAYQVAATFIRGIEASYKENIS